MKKWIVTFLGFACITIAGIAQQDVPAKIDKSKLTLKPNSREYAAVRMTNMHQRMELRKSRTMMLRKELAKKRLQQMRKGQRSIQQQQRLIQQRRALRQRMIQQQRQRNLRR